MDETQKQARKSASPAQHARVAKPNMFRIATSAALIALAALLLFLFGLSIRIF